MEAKYEKRVLSKENEFFIKLAAILLILIVVSLIMKLGVVVNNNLAVNTITKYISGFSRILCLFAAILCFLYNKRSEKSEIFILALMYIVLSLRVVPHDINYFTETGKIINIENSFKLLNSIFSILILSLAILPLSRLKSSIINNKIISVILVCIISVGLSIIEQNLISLNNLKTINFTIKYEIILVVVYFVAAVYFIWESIKYGQIIFIVCSGNMIMLGLKAVYVIMDLKNPTTNLASNIVSISFTTFTLIILGLFIEINNYICEKNNMENKIAFLYELIENNTYSEIILCNEANELIYCTEKLKETVAEKYNIEATIDNINNLFEEKKRKISNGLIEQMRNAVAEGGVWKGEIEIEQRILEISIRSLNVSEIEGAYYISFTDISEQYKIREVIKENDQKIKSLTEHIKDLIISVDNNGTIEYANKSMAKLLSMTREEIIGNNIYSFIVGEVEHIKEIAQTGEKIIHCLVKSKNGSLYKLETIISPIYDENGIVNSWVLVCRDLEYRSELQKLKIKYDEIKEYNEVKNTYFTNLSHELRTPTNVIYSTVQLLSSQLENDSELFIESYKKYEGSLIRNCFRMLRLITNIIDVSKIETGDLDLEKNNIDIVNLVEEITLSIIPYVEEMKMNIVFDTNVEELVISCDIEKIERVILNLLSNAIKFTSTGGSIFVSVQNEEEWVYIKVKDDGIGIPNDMKEKVFERFVQVNKSLNRLKEGSGIGLALVKSIVELHGGEIYLNDQVTVGSEFIVKLPNVAGEYEDSSFEAMIDKPINEKILIELSDIYGVKKNFNK